MEDPTRATTAAPLSMLADDTMVSAEWAALYLRMLPVELADLRTPHRPGERIGKGPKTQSPPPSYALGVLRDMQKARPASSAPDALSKAGLLGWMTTKLPFFAELEPRVKRGRRVLIGSAWDAADPDREARFADLVNGRVRSTWLTSQEAATSLWSDPARHRAFAARGLALHAADVHAIEVATGQTAQLAGHPPATKGAPAA